MNPMLRPGQPPQILLGALLSIVGAGVAQTPPPPPPQDQSAEMTTHDTPATFRTKVNLVLVPVVVRDKEGHAVGNLHKEDFQLFDKGKPQTISSFSMETLSSQMAEPAKVAAPVENGENGLEGPVAAKPEAMPNRFVAYVFDDVHIGIADLMQVRAAAERHLNSSLVDTDRAAIFTTSGRTTLDFTDDRVKLRETLLHLAPQPIARSPVQACPDISYYQADLIFNKNDPMALTAAIADAMACMSLDPTQPTSQQTAQSMAMAETQHVLTAGDVESRAVLTVLQQVVRRISTMPGKRTVVLVSPGFLTLPDLYQEKTSLIDRAIHANVIVSSLNARGLYVVVPGGDASQPSAQSIQSQMIKSQYETGSALANDDVLGELAYGTGGVFFHNNNDLVEPDSAGWPRARSLFMFWAFRPRI